MKYLKSALAILTLATIMGMSGCGTDLQVDSDNLVFRTAIEIATVTLIEQSDEISQADVIDTLAEIRGKISLDGQITATELIAVAAEVIDFEKLSPYERVLLLRVMDLAEQRLKTYGDLTDVSATADQILIWIDGAARLATPGT